MTEFLPAQAPTIGTDAFKGNAISYFDGRSSVVGCNNWRTKRLAKRILKVTALQLSAIVFLLSMSGLSIGRATGLRVLDYIPPNLIPSVEIVSIVVNHNHASHQFELPN